MTPQVGSPQDAETDGRCAHSFVRFRCWPVKNRWRCRLCWFVTRLYDGVDYAAGRPVHPHMSVAVRGYNTVPRHRSPRFGQRKEQQQ